MTPSPSAYHELSEAVRRAAFDVAPAHLRRMAEVVSAFARWESSARFRISARMPAPASRQHAERICEVWESTCPDLAGPAVALVLRATADLADEIRRSETVELVWTGPATGEVAARATADVLLELISQARSELLIVSFATFGVPSIQIALAGAAENGVRIMLVSDTAVDSGGRLTRDGVDVYRPMPRTEVYAWPRDARPRVGDGVASLHAKAAVADRQKALIGSANLTRAALSHNMELGVLVTGGAAPERLSRHFDDMILRGTLRRVL